MCRTGIASIASQCKRLISDVPHYTSVNLTYGNLTVFNTPKKSCSSYCSTEAWICLESLSVISALADDMYQHLFRNEPAPFYFAFVYLSEIPAKFINSPKADFINFI